MIITLQFKTPDVLDQIDEQLPFGYNVAREDMKWIESYIKYGENLIVDFNTETKTVTCRIVK